MNQFIKHYKQYVRISLKSPFFWVMLMAAIGFIALGQWQINRARVKSTWMAHQALAPSHLSWQALLDEKNDLSQTNIHLGGGHWLSQGFIKDRIVFNDHLGFQVYCLYCSEVGCVVVNLGWAAEKKALDVKLPQNIHGVLRRMPRAFIKEKLPLSTRLGLYAVVNLDPHLVQAVVKRPIAKYEVIIDPVSSDYVKMADPSVISVARHYGYALQFDLFALVIIIGYLYFIKNDL
jgi:cytochrome oxidase assembly protein ShyY1